MLLMVMRGWKLPLVGTIWMIEPDSVPAVVDSKAKSVPGGLTDVAPVVVRGFDAVPEWGGAALVHGVGAVCAGGVAYPRTVTLSNPGFGGVAVAGDEGEVVPSPAGEDERGEELEGVGLVGDDIGGKGCGSLVAFVVDGAKRPIGRVVAV